MDPEPETHVRTAPPKNLHGPICTPLRAGGMETADTGQSLQKCRATCGASRDLGLSQLVLWAAYLRLGLIQGGNVNLILRVN